MKRFIAALTLSLLLPCACAPQVYDNPVPVMLNKEKSTSDRLSAARQAHERFANDPGRLAALRTLLYERGQPAALRELAVDHLLEHDADAFRYELAHRIVLIPNLDVIEHLCDRAVQQRWPGFTPTLVRSLARPSHDATPDDQRPEYRAILALNPGKTVTQSTLDTLVSADPKVTDEQKGDAYQLLARLTPPDELLDFIRKAPVTSAALADLKTAADELRLLPANRAELLWLLELRQPPRAEFWNKAGSVIAQLGDDRRAGLAIRHLPVIVHLDPAALRMTREDLILKLAPRITSARHHMHSTIIDGQARDYPQDLAHWRDKLRWADLVTLRTLLAAVHDPSVRDELFRQADLDRSDTTTEYGGVLDWSSAGPPFKAHLYAPMIRDHDRKYVPSSKLFEHLHTALAHYHFHCQDHDNEDFAGPGRGDLQFANTHGPNGLLMTFVSRDELNIDYYQPGGIVIDLGTIHR